MLEDNPFEHSPATGQGVSESVAGQEANLDTTDGSPRQSQFLAVWESISQAGLAETAMRLGTHVLLLALILLVVWGMRQFYRSTHLVDRPQEAAQAAAPPTPTSTPMPPQMPPYEPRMDPARGIQRLVSLHTNIPSKPRLEISTYTVKKGDTLFAIAEHFGLKPETILWGNYFTLRDDPHNLRDGQELNILPVDGTYYQWQAGDGLNGVSKFFGVTPEEIVNFSGNNLNSDEVGDYAQPRIEPGTWLIVPGGTREYITWSAPAIPRDNPTVGNVLGPGACGQSVDGPVGAGAFIWPANNQFLSGFDYSPATNHFGIDIDGNTGDAIYAADNGVIVYAGWNNWGYGNVVVINHGNGWQTLYAHLSAVNVGCGQNVWQTNVIGAIGSTGNSTGSHLHFEMMYNGTKVNPWDYLP